MVRSPAKQGVSNHAGPHVSSIIPRIKSGGRPFETRRCATLLRMRQNSWKGLSMPDITTNLLDVADLCRMFEESESASLSARKDAERDRDYVDGKQLKAKELAELERRLTTCHRRLARGVRLFKSATLEGPHTGEFICMAI
jgi:hypothetical protein